MMSRREVITGGLVCGLLLVALVMPHASGDIPEKPERFPVTVRVDFGPLDREGREELLMVDEGSTPKDVVSMLFPFRSGVVCCKTREIFEIDGVRPDQAKNRWWSCELNDSRKLSPFQTVLKPNDRVAWNYIEVSQ